MAEVTLENVTKRFGQATAVNDLSLIIADGEFVVLLGPTGAGKTTTLRLVAGLEQADAGRIAIAGHDMRGVNAAGRDVAFVFQQFSLYPHLSVYDNLAFPLRAPARRVPEDQIRARVGEVAEMLRISKKLANKATQLSGGEMQRVAIGRALVRRPSIYLMDEPLSSLDAKLRADLRLELKRIQVDLGATVLFVTHDQIEAMTMADRIGVLDHGRLVQVGTPREIYEDPRNIYVASRLGQPQINLVPMGVLDVGRTPPGTATLGIRTENLEIRPAKGGKADARIEWVEHLGDQNHVHIDVAGHRLVTLAQPGDDVRAGDAVRLNIVRPLYFDANGERLRA
jgi:multiple sugar transport system ATP-binding protein